MRARCRPDKGSGGEARQTEETAQAAADDGGEVAHEEDGEVEEGGADNAVPAAPRGLLAEAGGADGCSSPTSERLADSVLTTPFGSSAASHDLLASESAAALQVWHRLATALALVGAPRRIWAGTA